MSARFALAAAALACALAGPARAAEGPEVPAELATACRAAVETAAMRHGVPPALLLAVSQVESSFHPFALNIAGRAAFPATYRDAQALAVAALRAGKSVDIGCLQINISKHHRRAFPTMLHALHPDWNADYGAGFMRNLYDRFGSWEAAAANYHSSRREAQVRYVAEVGRRMSAMASPTGRAQVQAPRSPGPDGTSARAVRVAEAARTPYVVQRSHP